MYIKIDRASKIPAYKQIYSELRNRILSGACARGSKLPSKRELARDCLVSIVTVERAYQILCDEGYCETRLRSGCYVAYSVDAFFPVSTIEEKNERPNDAGDAGYEDLPFSVVAKMLRKVILYRGERILVKSPNRGALELRSAICRYLSRCRDIAVSPEQIVIGSGAEYLYGVCVQMLGRERVVALENPSYEKIKAVYNVNGAVCDLLAMDDEGIKVDELNRTNASVLHVTPFNSFPSGVTASARRRVAYLQWAKERNAIVVEDDYDSEFVLNGLAPRTLFAQSEDENVIYLNTFSKTVAPALRMGYMILPKRFLPLYEKTVGFYSCTAPMLEQFFLAEWLDSGEFERTISRIRKKTASRRGSDPISPK